MTAGLGQQPQLAQPLEQLVAQMAWVAPHPPPLHSTPRPDLPDSQSAARQHPAQRVWTGPAPPLLATFARAPELAVVQTAAALQQGFAVAAQLVQMVLMWRAGAAWWQARMVSAFAVIV